jgi:hypothetical protein
MSQRVNVVENVEYAISQAAKNDGAQEVALTDAAPLVSHLRRTGQQQAEAFEWRVTKLPEDQIVPARRVREVAMALFMDSLRSRQREERQGWTDGQHREAVVTGNEAYEKLSQTHPRLVILVTGSEITPKKLQHLLELIELRERHEQGAKSLDEQKQEVSAYFMSNFVRPALPGEEEEAVATGRGLRGTMVTREDIQREQQQQ